MVKKKAKKASATKMKHTTKKTASAAQPAKSSAPLVTAQPQFKQQAAIQSGMFLYTSDSWSNAYFNDNDLHSLERQLFG